MNSSRDIFKLPYKYIGSQDEITAIEQPEGETGAQDNWQPLDEKMSDTTQPIVLED
ncbi:MAG TPA: hypothetical protein VMV24_02030 [Candidatus Dormibacteraeota bacterium]|nr:hypothetical protein [Candidatus Dormibacteraeota bacterium]